MTDTVPLRQLDAANWLVRTALPNFLAVAEMTDEAAWFRELPPLEGFDQKSRLAWRGAVRRVDEAQADVHAAVMRAVDEIQSNGGRVDYYQRKASLLSDRAPQMPEVCNFARHALLPSRVGWIAYRAMGNSIRLTMLAYEILGGTGVPVELDQALEDSMVALHDRALIDQMVRS